MKSLILFCFGLVIACGRPESSRAEEKTQPKAAEYQIKAAYLSKFARYTRWPAHTFADEADTLVIGVLGQEAVGSALAKALAGQNSAGRPTRLQRLDGTEGAACCHILFIGADAARDAEALLEGVSNRPVLTVGETEDFLAQGGIIRFFIRERRVKIAVNIDALEETQLHLSSRLLRMAKVLRDTVAEGRAQ